MRMNLQYVHLPQEFTWLLQSNMQSTGNGFSHLKKTIWSTSNFQSLASRTFSDLEGHLSFEKVITSLGWLGFRDRLAGAYLYHQKYGVFPEEPCLDLVSDILDFEDSLKGQTIDGYNRAFLLGFYLKMNLLGQKRNNHSFKVSMISSDVSKLLELVNTKTTYIDWLYISLANACEVHGLERVRKLLEAGGGFASLRRGMTNDQDYQFIRSFLAYGASIGHLEVFYNPTI